MRQVLIVGSGASGVHAAQTLLEKGCRVAMVDVGIGMPPPVRPADDLNGLKANLEDPADYFLGAQYQSLILPDFGSEYYGFPPNKEYIFEQPEQFRYRAKGFSPLVSFAAGGLAEAWTGGSYPFHDEELRLFPFGYKELGPYYGKVARRIGITGVEDDMARFFPLHDGLMEPLDLDDHSAVLLSAYAARRDSLNRDLGCYLGRARLAALSRDFGERKRCDYTGRCLWGCPRGSIYTPSMTLADCRRHPDFDYHHGLYAMHFRFTDGGRIRTLVARSTTDGSLHEFEAEALVLAAGTLSSARIFLESIRQNSGESLKLTGLMDNRQVLMPFVNLRMLGRQFNPRSYQYHQLAFGLTGSDPMEYVHGLVTTLKTALIHPVVQNMPLDLGGAVAMFRDVHAALGLVNINFHDFRREENYLALEDGKLVIHYQPDPAEPDRVHRTSEKFRKILRKLGCVAPPGMTHLRPMGASVHYAGAIPMSADRKPLTCSPHGQSHDFENLYFADGTSFPALPAKNLTFTLMANATRIAEEAF